MAMTAVMIEKPDSSRRATGRVRSEAKKNRDPSRNRLDFSAARGVSVTLCSPTRIVLCSGDGSGAGTVARPDPGSRCYKVVMLVLGDASGEAGEAPYVWTSGGAAGRCRARGSRRAERGSWRPGTADRRYGAEPPPGRGRAPEPRRPRPA